MTALSAGTVSLPVKPDTNGFGEEMSRGIMGQSSAFSGVGKAIGLTVAAGVTAAAVGIGAILATGIGEAKDASAGVAQLEAGIKSTGNAAGVSVQGMTDLAGSIQAMSGQTDDSIVKAEQLLLTFTNIRNSGPDKIFDQATQAAADMAAKMGGDASSQAILLGKALNDPVKGITALTRVGVSFTKGQKDQIAAMVAAGDTMGAQKVILKELNTEFGGAAKAAGESLPGQLERVQRSFEDLSQGVVETFLPILTPAITGLMDLVRGAQPIIQDVAVFVKNFLTQAFEDLQPVLTFVGATFVNLGGFIVGTLVPAVSALGTWIKNNSTWLLALAGVVVGAVAAFKAYELIMSAVRIATVAWTVVQGILNGTLVANPIGLIVMAIGALVAGIIWVATQTTFFQDAWAVMTTVIGTAWNWLWGTVLQPVITAIGAIFTWVYETIIVPIVAGIVIYVQIWAAIFTWLYVNVIQPVFAAIGAVFAWLWENAIRPVVDFVSGGINGIASVINNLGVIVGLVFGAIGDTIRGAFEGVVNFVRGIFNSIIGIVNNIIDGINGATSLAGAIGINIGAIPHLPGLAEGGTVLPRPGGTPVILAEGGKPETVVDTGKMNALLDRALGNGGAQVTQNITMTDADPRLVLRQAAREFTAAMAGA